MRKYNKLLPKGEKLPDWKPVAFPTSQQDKFYTAAVTPAVHQSPFDSIRQIEKPIQRVVNRLVIRNESETLGKLLKPEPETTDSRFTTTHGTMFLDKGH